MSLGYLGLVMAMVAIFLGSLKNDEVGRAGVRADLAFMDWELSDQLHSGEYYYADRDRWYEFNILATAIIFERVSQIAKNYGSQQNLNVSDLGITGFNGGIVSTSIEVNGFNQAKIVLTLPSQINPTTFISSLNNQLGNQFAGIFDGSNLVSSQGYQISVPSGFSALSVDDVVLITP